MASLVMLTVLPWHGLSVRILIRVMSSLSFSAFLSMTYHGMGPVHVYRGKTNIRSNDMNDESVYNNRQNPIISLCELS